jgi:hypothetical protein
MSWTFFLSNPQELDASLAGPAEAVEVSGTKA